MPMEMVVVKTKDNGVTSDDVKQFFRRTSKQRILRKNEDGIPLYRFSVYTDDPEGLEEREEVRVIPFFKRESDLITDPAYRKLDIMTYAHSFGEGTKTCIVDPRLVFKDFSLMELASGVPDAGTTNETFYKFTPEETEEIAENKTNFIQQATNWWDTSDESSKYHHSLLMFVQGHWDWIYDEFRKDSENIQTTYPGEEGFQKWLETFIDTPKVRDLPLPNGVLCQYTPHDAVGNTLMNDKFEELVRATWTEWRGIGGDEESLLFEFDHEYRDVSKHCSFLYLNQPHGHDAREDEWLDLWVL